MQHIIHNITYGMLEAGVGNDQLQVSDVRVIWWKDN
jgi:hypothetical protein